MAIYGNESTKALSTADPELILLFNAVVMKFDNKILFGHRDPALQFELWKKGRSLVGGEWVITDPSKVVTYKDGHNTLSKHNYYPSKAVDAAPYPINWKDTNRIYLFAGYVLGIAERLRADGAMTSKIRWGGDWNQNTLINDETFLDLVHFELID